MKREAGGEGRNIRSEDGTNPVPVFILHHSYSVNPDLVIVSIPDYGD